MPAFTARADRPNLSLVTYIVGDTLTLTFTVVDAAGEPIDLTDATLRWGVAKRVSVSHVGPVLVSKTPVVASPATGVAVVTLDAGDLLEVGDLAHELKMTIDDVTTTVARGWFRSLMGVITTA